MDKCNCCGNYIIKHNLNEYNKMTQEQINEIKKQHKSNCEWAEHLQKFYDTATGKNTEVFDLEYPDLIKSLKLNTIYEILCEKGIIDEADFKERMIKKANKSLNFELRDDLVKYIEKTYNSK